jgi:hypothetical protein
LAASCQASSEGEHGQGRPGVRRGRDQPRQRPGPARRSSSGGSRSGDPASASSWSRRAAGREGWPVHPADTWPGVGLSRGRGCPARGLQFASWIRMLPLSTSLIREAGHARSRAGAAAVVPAARSCRPRPADRAAGGQHVAAAATPEAPGCRCQASREVRCSGRPSGPAAAESAGAAGRPGLSSAGLSEPD